MSEARAFPTEREPWPAGSSDAGLRALRDAAALDIVRTLCSRLADECVAYCHWKSNDLLERALRGDSDLDLLVRREDAERFEHVLHGSGFLEVEAPALRRVPGVFHSYGLDAPSGRLAHIHAHYQLVLGDDTTKNYRLPIEDAYLASSEREDAGMPVPSPEYEFIVFVLRMVLKHATWDAIVSGKGGLSAAETDELAYLTERADLHRGGAVLHEHLPMIDAPLFDRCLWSLRPGTSRLFSIRTAHRVERALSPYARRRYGTDAVIRLWRRVRTVVRRHVLRRRLPRGRLAGGGAVVAVVGGDGAGKSTVVAELAGWLSEHISTLTVHLGKPRRSWTSAIVQGLRRGSGRAVARGPAVTGASLAASDGTSMTLRATLRLARQVTVARDRYLESRRARRAAGRGCLVIADRYPLPEIRLMDGPLASNMLTTPGSSRIVRLLARLERRYYERIADPDIVIVLRVSPEVAAERRRGIDDEGMVRRRSEEIRGVDWHRISAIVIDADRPQDEMLSAIRSALWARL
jgi:thymidylate kinase